MRPAVLLFAIAACWRDRPDAQEPIANRDVATDLTGAYWCQIEDAGFVYPQFPCAIRKIEDHFVLAKLGGSQRFEGEVTPLGKGFSFAGQFFCPWGDCTQALHGTFKPTSRGGLRGTFSDAKFVVRMKPAPDSAFGGVSYGGDGYGGFSYGGH